MFGLLILFCIAIAISESVDFRKAKNFKDDSDELI